MFCKKCGAEVHEEAVVCVKCGCSTAQNAQVQGDKALGIPGHLRSRQVLYGLYSAWNR